MKNPLRLFDTQTTKDNSKSFTPSFPFIVVFDATARVVSMCVSVSPSLVFIL